MCRIVHLFIQVLPVLNNAITCAPCLRVCKCVLALTLQVSYFSVLPTVSSAVLKTLQQGTQNLGKSPLNHGGNAKHVTASFVFELAHKQTI